MLDFYLGNMGTQDSFFLPATYMLPEEKIKILIKSQNLNSRLVAEEGLEPPTPGL